MSPVLDTSGDSFYRDLINRITEGYWLLGPDQHIVEVNDSLVNMLGYRHEEFIGKHPFDFVDEENLAIFRSQIALAAKTLHRVYNITLKAKGGEEVHSHISATSVYDESGKLLHSFAFITNVSQLRHAEDVLHQTLGEQKIILENAEMGIALAGDRKFLRCNRQFEKLFGYGRDELKDRLSGVIHPSREAFNEFRKEARAVMGKGTPYRTERLMRRKDGELIWCRIVGKAIDPSDLPNGTLWMVEDISGQREAEENLRLAAKVFDSSIEGILITDAASRIITVNQAFTQITGYQAEDAIGNTPALLQSGKHNAEFYREMWRTLRETGQWRGEIWNRRKSGETYLEWLTISAVKNDKGEIVNFVAVFSDITSRKLAEERLNYLANHDALTGLPNRVLFLERLGLSLARAHRTQKMVAVMFFDLDRFKIINDTLGHAAGDQLLQEVALRVSTCLREDDTVARLGGDEFTVILEGIGEEKYVAMVAQKIIEILAKPIKLADHEMFITASVGISVYPNDGVESHALVRHADVAMYRAKEMGKNNYQFFKTEMNTRAFERLTLENSLRRALERNEFELHYQPQLDLRTGRVVGAEALIRWRHPDMGLISPDRFIPIAEETGLIIPIGEWVLRSACAQNKAWQKAGHAPLHVAVNLSGRQFKQKDLLRMIERAFAESGLSPEYLELEITESVIMEHADETIATLACMKSMGFQLSIDDFGTGYSSLSYLKRFPIDTLKIDRSFVRDITTDQDDAAITAAVIALAHSLKLKVVAEGVENAEQLEFLRGQGCDMIQGFHFSRPMSVDAFTQRLAAGWESAA
ncbi:MAG: EAL domain-containing protein [Sulfuricella sp.]|nr:EAL domain-containing protein [Sulfuricella sp.]